MECYINGTNVALSSTGSTSYFTKSNDIEDTTVEEPGWAATGTRVPNVAIDGDLIQYNHSSGDYYSYLVELSQSYIYSQLQRIIVYNLTGNTASHNDRYGNRIEIQLLDENKNLINNIQFTPSNTSTIYYNYIGPSTTALDSSKIFTSNNTNFTFPEISNDKQMMLNGQQPQQILYLDQILSLDLMRKFMHKMTTKKNLLSIL